MTVIYLLGIAVLVLSFLYLVFAIKYWILLRKNSSYKNSTELFIRASQTAIDDIKIAFIFPILLLISYFIDLFKSK